MRYVMEMELTTSEIANIFESKDWYYATNGCFGIPNKDDIATQIYRLLGSIQDDMDFIQSGRLALVRSAHNPDNFQIFLEVGNLYGEPLDPKDLDRPIEDEGFWE